MLGAGGAWCRPFLCKVSINLLGPYVGLSGQVGGGGGRGACSQYIFARYFTYPCLTVAQDCLTHAVPPLGLGCTLRSQ